MSSTTRLFAGLAAAAAVIIGGIYVLQPRTGVGGPGTTPSVAPSTGPSPSQVATVAATADSAACRLITPDEAKNSTDEPGLGAFTAATGSGAVTSCIYSTGGGDIVLQLTLTSPGGQTAFEAMKATAGVQPVAGVGAQAVYDPSTETMYVVKGDSVVALHSGQYVSDREAAETQLAKLAVGRL